MGVPLNLFFSQFFFNFKKNINESHPKIRMFAKKRTLIEFIENKLYFFFQMKLVILSSHCYYCKSNFRMQYLLSYWTYRNRSMLCVILSYDYKTCKAQIPI